MTSRKKPPADRSREKSVEEPKERRSSRDRSGNANRETPSKSKAGKKLSRNGRARMQSQTSSSVPSRSDIDEESSSNKTTPQRFGKCKPWSSGINSPSNDAEQQNEIFWDPNSPTHFVLENGRKKCAASKCTVDISDIVNRIAPKDEKPANSDAAYLGVWIGDDAIPCTPVMARTRMRLSRSRILKTEEEELMKLAKQLDKNLVEHKNEELLNSDITSKMVDTETAHLKEDESFLEDIPEEDISLALNSVSQGSGAGTPPQKTVDKDTEDALNALFDCPTQKFSGQLSQGLSDISTGSVHEVPGKSNNDSRQNLKHNKHLGTYENNARSDQCSHSDVFKGSKSTIVEKKEAVQPVLGSQDDFEDDWGTDILEDDSFIMEITQNPSLIATPKTDKYSAKQCLTNLDTKRAKCNVKGTNTASNKVNHFKFAPRKLNVIEGQNVKSSELKTTNPANRNVKSDSRFRSVSETCSSTESCVPLKLQINSGVAKNNETYETNTSYTCGMSKNYSTTNGFSSNALNSREKPQMVQSVQSQQPAHTAAKIKDCVQNDEWNDPKFSDEVLDMFCESDSLWEEHEEEDDELLYQVCNDVERLSQVQDHEERNPKAFEGAITSQQNKNSNHITSSLSCTSNQLNGNSMRNKAAIGGISVTAVSGNSLNPCQKQSQKANQTPASFNRSNCVPSGGDYKKPMSSESYSQHLLKPQTAINNTTHSFAPSKYSFTKLKVSQVQPAHSQPCHPGNERSSSVHPHQDFGENKNKRSTFTLGQSGVPPSQQTSLKRHLSESTLHSSKVFVSESSNKKCSMEEIQRKKQEALARRNLKARTCSSDMAPT